MAFFASVGRSLRDANRWLIQTPDRALEQAYDAALMIKAIEDEHFQGDQVPLRSPSQDTVLAYFQTEVKKYLKLAEIRLTEFKASRVIVDSTHSTLYNRSPNQLNSRDREGEILAKLQFIDMILARYQAVPASQALVPVPPAANGVAVSPANGRTGLSRTSRDRQPGEPNGYLRPPDPDELAINPEDSILDKTGVLPRSILGTLNRIKRDLDPKSETEMLRTFRTSKAKTLVSIRLLLLLIIVPLLVQQLSKAFIVGPIVDRVWKPEQTGIFLNYELEEQALREFNTYRERLEFERLLGIAPTIPEGQPEAEELILQEKAREIAQSYAGTSAGALKNIFADILSAIAFAVVLVTNRRGLDVLKSFIDETVYGLSDSAKAFIIILFTDMFVGFHSPHGWEILLEGLAKHFGLPANRDFIFLFIATFPVILDTIFKYWIFRYLNRISPSAVATYKNMNET